jgi:hypothetical protein
LATLRIIIRAAGAAASVLIILGRLFRKIVMLRFLGSVSIALTMLAFVGVSSLHAQAAAKLKSSNNPK